MCTAPFYCTCALLAQGQGAKECQGMQGGQLKTLITDTEAALRWPNWQFILTHGAKVDPQWSYEIGRHAHVCAFTALEGKPHWLGTILLSCLLVDVLPFILPLAISFEHTLVSEVPLVLINFLFYSMPLLWPLLIVCPLDEMLSRPHKDWAGEKNSLITSINVSVKERRIYAKRSLKQHRMKRAAYTQAINAKFLPHKQTTKAKLYP